MNGDILVAQGGPPGDRLGRQDPSPVVGHPLSHAVLPSAVRPAHRWPPVVVVPGQPTHRFQRLAVPDTRQDEAVAEERHEALSGLTPAVLDECEVLHGGHDEDALAAALAEHVGKVRDRRDAVDLVEHHRHGRAARLPPRHALLLGPPRRVVRRLPNLAQEPHDEWRRHLLVLVGAHDVDRAAAVPSRHERRGVEIRPLRRGDGTGKLVDAQRPYGRRDDRRLLALLRRHDVREQADSGRVRTISAQLPANPRPDLDALPRIAGVGDVRQQVAHGITGVAHRRMRESRPVEHRGERVPGAVLPVLAALHLTLRQGTRDRPGSLECSSPVLGAHER